MKIVIVDDEIILSTKIAKKLENQGFSVIVYNSYKKFFQRAPGVVDLYVIDLSLRDGSGIDIIKHLRATDIQSPIMIISGYGDTDNITHGLDIWADDYMVKPLIPEEFLARIRALMRRPRARRKADLVYLENLSFDKEAQEFLLDEEPITLPKKEYLTLEILMESAGKIVKREELIEYVWWDLQLDTFLDNTLNTTISRLKKKIGDKLEIQVLYKAGYILSPKEQKEYITHPEYSLSSD